MILQVIGKKKKSPAKDKQTEKKNTFQDRR